MNETHPTIEQLIDYQHGALGPSEDATIHAHLAHCQSCAEAHEAEASLTELLRAHARAEERELPASVAAGIRDSIERAPRTGAWQALRAAFRPVVLVPAAVALAAVLYLGAHSWRVTPASTQIDAAYYVNSHAALTATAPFSEDAPIPATLTSDTTTTDQPPADETR
jgi:predicted anti-sigma-YlaC factor YlaD